MQTRNFISVGFRRRVSAFTLIELLVVMSIIALLISLLIPALAAAKDHARVVGCQENLKQIQIMAQGVYLSDYKDTMVPVMGLASPTRVLAYRASSLSSAVQDYTSGYSLSFMDLLNPRGIDSVNSEPVTQNPMWYCPADVPWKRWGTPAVREVTYAMNLYLSYFNNATAAGGLKYYKSSAIVNPSAKAFIVESHHKGVQGVRLPVLQLYSQNNNTTAYTLAMAPSMYYATGAMTSSSPRRHKSGFNASYCDGHVAFAPIDDTPVWSDGATTGTGLSLALWSAAAATVWFDPSGTYFNSSIAEWKTLWDPTKN